MALLTTVARDLACNQCRQWALRSFIASIGGTSTQQRTLQRRPFSTPTRRRDEARESIQQAKKDDLALNDINEEFSNPRRKEAEAEIVARVEPEQEKAEQHQSYVPWYLQVDPPIAPRENDISARQKVPDLPDHSPSILEPLLQRVSVELGMDDLTLLDLRELDPPPALGANLLMLIGTARSEKHLHVSADKLCRWLRSEHGMTPFADGLLGRQELKVKMRRRAKKSKLLSAVGAKATADTELDEGIRTGWVCVNVGRVEGGELPQTEVELEAEKNIVGFGTRITGSHVVVQLMTEDKRGQIDLEKLWTGQLKRSKKAKEELLKKEDEEAEQASNIPEDTYTGPRTSYNPVIGSSQLPQQQARAYHTSARRLQVPSLGVESVRNSGNFMETQASDSNNLPDKDFPEAREWRAHLEYLLEKPNLTSPNALLAARDEMQIDGHVPLEETYLTVLVSLLRNMPLSAYEQTLEFAFDVLEDMESHGYDPVRPEILELLYNTLVGRPSRSTSPTTIYSLTQALNLTRLQRLISADDSQGFWRAWRSFPQRFMPRHADMYTVLFDAVASKELGGYGEPGGFRDFAWNTNSFDVARQIISTAVVDMEAEQPPVVVEQEGVELAMFLYKAMNWADPEGQEKGWDEMRERCEAVMRE